jgi:hypothetical protein
MLARRSVSHVVVVVGAAALLGGCGFSSVATGETRNETVSFDLDDSKSIRAQIRMGTGKLDVKSGTPKLMEGRFAYNVPESKPVVEYRAGEINLSQPRSPANFGNTVNNWDLTLNGDVPLEIKAELGAGEANLELGRMNLSRVEVSLGAGEVNMDLRGDPQRSYSVQVRGGVGETVVYLPRNVGISATASKGIGGISVEGLERRDGVWVNPDKIDAPVTVRLDVKGGVGEIRLIR